MSAPHLLQNENVRANLPLFLSLTVHVCHVCSLDICYIGMVLQRHQGAHELQVSRMAGATAKMRLQRASDEEVFPCRAGCR